MQTKWLFFFDKKHQQQQQQNCPNDWNYVHEKLHEFSTIFKTKKWTQKVQAADLDTDTLRMRPANIHYLYIYCACEESRKLTIPVLVCMCVCDYFARLLLSILCLNKHDIMEKIDFLNFHLTNNEINNQQHYENKKKKTTTVTHRTRNMLCGNGNHFVTILLLCLKFHFIQLNLIKIIIDVYKCFRFGSSSLLFGAIYSVSCWLERLGGCEFVRAANIERLWAMTFAM